MVTIDVPAEVSGAHEGYWVAEKIHSGWDATALRAANDEHCVLVPRALFVQVFGD